MGGGGTRNGVTYLPNKCGGGGGSSFNIGCCKRVHQHYDSGARLVHCMRVHEAAHACVPVLRMCPCCLLELSGPASWQNGVFADFLFLGHRLFFADFLAGFLLLILGGRSAQKNPPGDPRENPPKFIQQKSSNTFPQIGRGKSFGKP